MKIFTEEEIRQEVKISKEALDHVEAAFQHLYEGEVSQPPVIRVDVPEHNGEADIKTAYIKGFDTFAIKVSAGFFNNPQKGLPSLGGLMLAMDSETGVPRALLQDNGYLTDVRTALAGAVAAATLAKDSLQTVGVIGTGMQARLQLEALQLVRPFQTVYVYGRRQEAAEKYKNEMEEKFGWEVKIAEDPAMVVQNSDYVVTTTPATTPLIDGSMLHPGVHVTAMGSDAEHKQELASSVFERADIVVGDEKSQVYTIGELHHAKEVIAEADVIELGKIVAGDHPGRTSAEQMTICDLTGTGVQDTAIANYALTRLSST